jgi:hypothetical protein
MKAIIVCILSGLSAVAAESNDVQVLTTTISNTQPSYLNTVDVFTRGGQTNLVRRTHTQGGAVLFRTQTFYHNGAELGQYIYNGAETLIGLTPGAPYPLSFRFDISNRLRSAFVGTIRTNAVTFTFVTLDSFGCTNGVFFPRDGSWIREVNSQPREFPLR